MFPVPFIKDQRSLQAAVFLDAGNVFDTDCGDRDEDFCQEPDIGELRYSVGIGGTWISGFGPITASIAFPLNAGEEDEREVFQFQLGQTF
jgi:outer membrane protein insertion porin family